MTTPREPFDDFFARYHRRLVGYLRRVGGCDADDVAQETMIRALRSYERLDPDRDPWPWLVVVARRVAADSRLTTRDVAGVAPGVMPDHADEVGERALMRTALGKLTAADRGVLVLRECHDLEIDELSHLLGRTPNAIRQQLFRARGRLARAYAGLTSRAGAVVGPGVVRLRARATRLGAAVVPATQVATSVAFVAVVVTGAPVAQAGAGPAGLGVATTGPAVGTAATSRLVRRPVVVRGVTATARPATRTTTSPAGPGITRTARPAHHQDTPVPTWRGGLVHLDGDEKPAHDPSLVCALTGCR